MLRTGQHALDLSLIASEAPYSFGRRICEMPSQRLVASMEGAIAYLEGFDFQVRHD